LAASAASLRTVRTADFQDLLRSRLRSATSTRLMADLIFGTSSIPLEKNFGNG
jgi:hypothetical protein